MKKTKSLVIAGMCFALGLLLPMLFHAIGLGSAFLPMHIPVLLCGLICGAPLGAVCGLFLPLVSSLLTGMPPIFPVMPAMMFELMAYGLLSGLCYRKFKFNIYQALILSMLVGRAVSGIANTVILGFAGRPYGLSAFIAASFVQSLPGIIMQIIIIPIFVVALERAGVIGRRKLAAKI